MPSMGFGISPIHTSNLDREPGLLAFISLLTFFLVCSCLHFVVFEMGSHVAQTDFELAVLRITLNS